MIKQTHYCDGCGKKLEGERLKEAQYLTQNFNKQMERTQTEIFCSKCTPLSLAYWEQNQQVVVRALSVASKTIEGHKRKFFSSSALKEVV